MASSTRLDRVRSGIGSWWRRWSGGGLGVDRCGGSANGSGTSGFRRVRSSVWRLVRVSFVETVFEEDWPMAPAAGRRASVRCLVCTSVLLPVAAAAPAAEASFPGRSGDIAFSRDESDLEDEGIHAPLWSVDPRTRDERRLTAVPRRCRRSESWWDSEPSYSPSVGASSISISTIAAVGSARGFMRCALTARTGGC